MMPDDMGSGSFPGGRMSHLFSSARKAPLPPGGGLGRGDRIDFHLKFTHHHDIKPMSRLSPGILTGLILLAPTDVFAYLNPGTSSMLSQMLIGGIVATFFTLKLYWRKVKGFLSRLVVGKTADRAGIESERRSQDEG